MPLLAFTASATFERFDEYTAHAQRFGVYSECRVNICGFGVSALHASGTANSVHNSR